MPHFIPEFLSFSPALAALLQVVLIDITLAGDNAVVLGMVAAHVPRAQRGKVMFWGLAIAVVLRILLAVLAATLLKIIGLMFAGGILLLWVAWRLYRDVRQAQAEREGADVAGGAEPAHAGTVFNLRRVILQITIADISMSLDNVLAVAGAAMDHIWVLAAGLILSIGMMGVAATLVARLLKRHPWISYAGLIIVFYVAISLIIRGGADIWHASEQAQTTRNSTAVASSLVLKRGYLTPNGSPSSIARNSAPSAARPFSHAAPTSSAAL